MKEKRQLSNEVIQFPYQDELITFLSGNREPIMVNATEMAKPFGKNTKDWLRLKSTKEFLSTLSSVRQISLSQLVIVNKGKSTRFTQGTWFHGDVAIEFARWLNPRFSIWCNDIIKMLLERAYLPNGIELKMQQLEQVDDSLEALRDKLTHLRLLGVSEDAPIIKSIKEELNK